MVARLTYDSGKALRDTNNMGIHGSITVKMMTRNICFDHINCYYSSSEHVTDEEDELLLRSNLYLVQE